uniref:Putative secreted protein n=1 Tax=Ixodes ricinus TaxID=34613 RepID=A0A6B0TSZ1_IXORI
MLHVSCVLQPLFIIGAINQINLTRGHLVLETNRGNACYAFAFVSMIGTCSDYTLLLGTLTNIHVYSL